MNKYSLVKRTIVVFSFLAVIVAVSSFGSGCSAGSAPNLDTGFEGSWTGELKAPGAINVVNLTLYLPGKATKDKSTLTYENPRSCTLTVKFSKNTEGNGREYSITESTGGFCDKLLLGKLSLERQEGNSLACALTSLDEKSSTKISEKGTLRRTGK
jgi:hypothetical protein